MLDNFREIYNKELTHYENSLVDLILGSRYVRAFVYEVCKNCIADQRPHKCTCEKPTAISKDVCGVCGGDLHG